MPNITHNKPPYRPPKSLEMDWDTFRKGLNTLLRPQEIEDQELVEADNLMLIGKGVPTKRWGTALYFQSAATGSVRALKGFYQKDGTNQLLAITDEGFLKIRSSASWASVNGASWASGSVINMAQIDNKMYVVSNNRELTRYSNPTLIGFATIAQPAGLFATQISGASGTNTYSYRVSAISNLGETLAAQPYQLASQPQDLVKGTVLFLWSPVSTASGVLTAYNIYGRNPGDERFLGTVGAGTNRFYDDGASIPQEFTFPPTADSTGGPKAKFIKRFQDRLIFAGIDGEPAKILISGRVPHHEKFDLSYGGNFIRIEPDAGDDITGIEVFQDKIIVFKERSIWQVTLSQEQVGNYYVTLPEATLVTASHGCIAPGSISPVENDIFFLSRDGVYALGYEPNILNVIRTNEISAKIRPDLETLTIAQRKNAIAFYDDFKYGVAFPGTDKTYIYDRERLAWMGPWSKDAQVFEKYYDSSSAKHLLMGGDESPNVLEYSEAFTTDSGESIITSLQSKKYDYGDWAIFKSIKQCFFLFRNIVDSVNVSIRIQDRLGNINTVKSFTINAVSVTNAGWGADQWGNSQWADSEEAGGASEINEVYRHTTLNKIGRTIQILITTSGNSNYELLAVRSTAKQIGYGFLPSDERV